MAGNSKELRMVAVFIGGFDVIDVMRIRQDFGQ